MIEKTWFELAKLKQIILILYLLSFYDIMLYEAIKQIYFTSERSMRNLAFYQQVMLSFEKQNEGN